MHIRFEPEESEEYALALKIEDLDTAAGCSAQPIAVRGEDESVDDVTGLERVEVLAVVEVPQHCNAILSAGGSKRAVGGYRNGVDITFVSEVVGAELAFCELPDLLQTLLATSQRRVDSNFKSEILVITKSHRDGAL